MLDTGQVDFNLKFIFDNKNLVLHNLLFKTKNCLVENIVNFLQGNNLEELSISDWGEVTFCPFCFGRKTWDSLLLSKQLGL